MQTPKRPRSSNSDEEPKLLEIVNKIKAKPNPSNKDLADFMVDFFMSTNSLSNRMAELEKEVEEISVKTNLHQERFTNVEDKIHEIENDNAEEKKINLDKFAAMQDEIDSLKNNTTNNTTQINLIQQQYLENEIIMKGFPSKPNVDEVVKNFKKSYSIADQEIKESYYVSYQLKPRNKSSSSKTVHFVVMKFKEKSTKIRVFNKKKTLGPLLLNTLDPIRGPGSTVNPSSTSSGNPPNAEESENNPKISIANKLTKFNLYVQRKLYKAKSLNIIHDYRYHNCLFQIVEEEGKAWIRIETYECMKPIELLIDQHETNNQKPTPSNN